jgi:aryl-alcohol dehydrogenase-like predicted oxidoreductase
VFVVSLLDFGAVVLGGNTFGWTSDRDESFAVLDKFVAAGGKSIDTADTYSRWVPGNSGGESETIIGEWLAKRDKRDDVVIGTKVFSLPARPGLSPANIRAAVDDSLRRLQTDYIDLYYAHRDDESVPQADYVGAFDELVKAGKVREVGASNFTAARLTSAISIAKDAGQASFTVSQDQYNLVERELEAELPILRAGGIVEIPYYALASGFLTGKYRPGVTVDSARSAGVAKYLENPANVALLDTLDAIAASHGVSVAAVSLAWLRQQTGIGAPIASARTAEQLDVIIEAFDLELTRAELEQLA